MSTIVCIVENGYAEVAFDGEHIPKREFLMALKAIDKSYRRQVKRYQHNRRLSQEKENGEAAEDRSAKLAAIVSAIRAAERTTGTVVGQTVGNSRIAETGNGAKSATTAKAGAVGKG